MRKITFTADAYAEYVNWLEKDRKIFLKITDLIREASRDPGKGIGKPELLKHELSGYWSRRINHEHRLVYSVAENAIEIKSCKYHY
ncbi:MAG: Txe/YoeB family addiction module toxin [Mariniphaga sp.]|jgi:toxin YoeB